MSLVLRLVLISATWVAIEIGSGFLVHHFPAGWFGRDRWLTRERGWERGGRTYQRLFGVRRWKDRLPEAGDWFAGGMRKRLQANHTREQLAALIEETRRAEITHWLPFPLSFSFFLWNPPEIAIWMPIVALLGNAPFIMVQRYNRPRIAHAADRRGRESDG